MLLSLKKHKPLRAGGEMVSKLVHSKSVWGILTISLWISALFHPKEALFL